MFDIENINILIMTTQHIDDVMIIENSSFAVPWSKRAFTEELTGNRFARYIVAEVSDKIIGYAGMWRIFDEGHITNIAVLPEFRGKGVGTRLIHNLIKMAKNENIIKMTLEVRTGNMAARKLYSNLGFIECGLRKGYYSDNGEDAIIMWKNDIY